MSAYSWGGSEELWSQAALRLRSQGHEVAASVEWWPQPSPILGELAARGIQLRFRKPAATGLFSRARRRLLKAEPPDRKWLRTLNPDLVVISQGGSRDGLEWMRFCLEKDLPYVVIAQCNADFWWPTDDQAHVMAEAYGAARKVYFVSRHNLKLLEHQITATLNNAVVVANPFKVGTGLPPVWPSQHDRWHLACVARLEPAAKGQDLLLQALANSRWQGRPFELGFYGSGPSRRSLEKLAERVGNQKIRFHGQVADVRGIWGKNHLLILASRWEGLPLALVEAMWCARPCVVTDVGGNAELCVDGQTGFVARAASLGLLEETLEMAWDHRHEWENMGRTARKRVEEVIPKDPVGTFCDELLGVA